MHSRPDPDVTAVYTAEDRLERWLDMGTVTVFGSRWALEPEVRFARVDDVQRYVDHVLIHLAAREWREPTTGDGSLSAVSVRPRRGATKAHYEPDRRTIAVPDLARGGAWALRESVVLHELAHHLRAVAAVPPVPEAHGGACDTAAHGSRWRQTLLALLTEAGHPTASALLGMAFSEERLR